LLPSDHTAHGGRCWGRCFSGLKIRTTGKQTTNVTGALPGWILGTMTLEVD
jgi:hypothetical protein